MPGPGRRATASEPALRASGLELTLRECPRCGSALTLGTAPDPLGIHRGAFYAQTRGWADRVVEPLRRLAYADLMRHFGHLPEGGRVLEVGCGDGRLLAGLAARGHDALGIEPSPPAAARTRQRGLRVIAAPLEDAADEIIRERPFDAVVFWHSLEHFDQPAQALRIAVAGLAPGGKLVVAVPNRASWQARLGGDLWFHQDVPRHRVHFTPTGLGLLLERCGFVAPSIHHMLVEQNPLGMWQTLLNRLPGERDELFRLLKRDPALGRPGLARRLRVLATASLLAPPALLAELAAAGARAGGSIVALSSREAL